MYISASPTSRIFPTLLLLLLLLCSRNLFSYSQTSSSSSTSCSNKLHTVRQLLCFQQFHCMYIFIYIFQMMMKKKNAQHISCKNKNILALGFFSFWKLVSWQSVWGCYIIAVLLNIMYKKRRSFLFLFL